MSATLVVVGALLPWYSQVGIDGVSRNAFQLGADDSFSIDGFVLLGLGVIVGLIGVVRLTKSAMPRWIQSSTIVPGIVVIAVALNDYPSLHSLANKVNVGAEGLAVGSVGIGIWLVIAGGVFAIAAGLILRKTT